MTETTAQSYLVAASKEVRSVLPSNSTKSDTHVAMLAELHRYEEKLKQQAAALREAIDYEATEALTEGMTYVEVAKPLGLTKQRIAQRYAVDGNGRSLKAAEFIRQVSAEHQ